MMETQNAQSSDVQDLWTRFAGMMQLQEDHRPRQPIPPAGLQAVARSPADGSVLDQQRYVEILDGNREGTATVPYNNGFHGAVGNLWQAPPPGYNPPDPPQANLPALEGPSNMDKDAASRYDCYLRRFYGDSSLGGAKILIKTREQFYNFSRLVESCDQGRLRALAVQVTSNRESFLAMCGDKWGSKLVRKLISAAKKSPVMEIILTVISGCFVELMTCKVGHHVVIESLGATDKDTESLISEAALRHALHVAQDEVGCIALNTTINQIRGSWRRDLLLVIASDAVCLAQHPSGNFVLQQVMDLQIPEVTAHICGALRGHFARIAMQKVGSYVVEKCLRLPHHMARVCTELFESDQLVHIARNQFGNYVIQSALKRARDADIQLYHELVAKLIPHHSALETRFGRNVLNVIEGESSGDKAPSWM